MNANVSSAGMVIEPFKRNLTPKFSTSKGIENATALPRETNFPNGLLEYYNWKDAKQMAKKQNKPIFIRFTNERSKNCNKMIAKICKNVEVLKILSKHYIVLVLNVSDKTMLSKKERYKSPYDGKLIRTVGRKNADYQVTQYFNNLQPFHVLTDVNDTLLTQPKGFDLEVNNFIEFLENGIRSFKKLKKKEAEKVSE
tara:strand:+ start:458 stop:1048 length:591 start_codon:yes stop_codon:yes gene_type:complete